MDKKHPEGYWIHQLTDEDLEIVLKNITENNKNALFIKMLEKTKTEKGFTIKYQGKRLHCYLSNLDPTIEFYDFKSNNSRASTHLVKHMIDRFGVEYIDEFIEQVDEYAKTCPENAWTKHYTKLKDYAKVQKEALNTKAI